MSSNVLVSDNSIRRERPRTGEGCGVKGGVSAGGVSRIQTAALLAFPEPRRMAGRPVDWMADIISEGDAVDLVVRSCLEIVKEVSCMPSSWESAPDMSLTQESQCIGTAKVASYCGPIFLVSRLAKAWQGDPIERKAAPVYSDYLDSGLLIA